MESKRGRAYGRQGTVRRAVLFNAGLLLTLLVLPLGACRPGVPGDEAGAPNDPGSSAAPQDGTTPPDTTLTPASGSPDASGQRSGAVRAEQRTDTIQVEGMPQAQRSLLFRAPWREPLAFSTYVPDDMIAESSGDTVRFIADFGGVRQDSAFVQVVALPPGITPDRARGRARRIAEGVGLQDPPPAASGSELPWAIAEFAFRGSGCSAPACPTGVVALAAHGGRYFLIRWQYPAEYGDGMGPRIRWLIEEWQWQDSGDRLAG